MGRGDGKRSTGQLLMRDARGRGGLVVEVLGGGESIGRLEGGGESGGREGGGSFLLASTGFRFVESKSPRERKRRGRGARPLKLIRSKNN